MTTVTLKFWAKGNKERVYINDGRESLGYFERITDAEERMPTSYYNRHRLAKGDAHEYSENYRFVGDDDIRQRLIAALEIVERVNDDYHNFTEVSKKARGGFPAWFGNTPKKEADKIRRTRDVAEYTI